ncbi:MAG: DEAD/DEAH box helicase family protein [Caldilineaceae bacterium]|nr:DEAD/DEAH box helicase family protein [Caldilineaceae bacterium]
MFELRQHQIDAIEAALAKSSGSALTAVIPPGGGKTILALAVLDTLYKARRIDAAVVLTPRLGLCSQFELDWKAVRRYFQPNAMGAIVHRENAALNSLRGFGYVSSYQSLCADPAAHRRFARRYAGRLAIVCDEAHYLGEKLYGSGDTTQAAKILGELDEFAAFKLVMTGTPYRADENPIIFADYSDQGRILADVELTYGDGVVQGFLRPFDATLFDGKLYQIRTRARDGRLRSETEEIELRYTNQQLTKVATDPQFWQLAVRHAFEKVKELQEIWPRYCGIVGCANQAHAREVLAYLQNLGARSLLAVSDDSNAHENLRSFKSGSWDMLVTVGMAHVGYDHKPIAVAAVLNGIREFNWLDQFTMRAGRMLPNRPKEEQTAWIFGINDRAMRKYVTTKRVEAQRAIKMVEDAGGTGNSANVVYTGSDGPRLLYRGITLEGISGIGFGHNGYSATLDEDPPVTPGFEDDEPDLFTEKEKREQLRRRRQGLVSQYAGKMHGQVNGDTIRQVNATLLQRFGKPVNQCNPEELERQIAWLEEQLGLNVADIEQAKQEPVIAETDEPDYVQFGLF